MGKTVECVPNFSEGRDLNKINAIVDEARAVPGVVVLDVEKDADHNRTVLTFVAPEENAVEAMFRVVKKSAELIDLNRHQGEHPRMGATDVAPFIPVMGTTVEQCVRLAETLAERIGRELEIPAYLYDCAARVPERRNLAAIRKGQFEGLRELIGKDPARTPDFGPDRIHPTAGAIAVGARRQIVNFNVNLDTADMEFGAYLARKIRTSGGGLPALRAKEIFLETRGIVQISTVLTDYHTTSVERALEEIRRELAPRGIKIVSTELIGLTTQDALVRYTAESLKLENFDAKTQILETRLAEMLGTWQSGANVLVEALAADTPTPGGGSAGAVSAAMGCALLMMAAAVSARSKKVDESHKPALNKAVAELKADKAVLQGCISEDSRAYDLFTEAAALPKGSPERTQAMQSALRYAAEVPLKTAQTAHRCLAILREIEPKLSPNVASDFRSAGFLLDAGIKCAVENVHINMAMIKDETVVSGLSAALDGLRN
ncbi:MAG: glutamate formimidoyltransferase [Elusimicrobiaceae bacterium]|nr:glutamate formimidoyltransferase [Elusimicrobiaceae bacterium]